MRLPIPTSGAFCAPMLLALFFSNTCSSAIVATGDALFDDAIRVASNSGDGSLLLTEPTSLQGGGIFVAEVPNSRGSVIIDGATYEIDSSSRSTIQVGTVGTGSLEILNGGRVSNHHGSFMPIGSTSSSIGNVRVAGANSLLYLPSTTLLVSHGSFLVEDGAVAIHDSANFNLGRRGGSDDPTTAIIEGQGSQWDVLSNMSIGGNLTIRDGGLVRSGLARQGSTTVGGFNQPGLVIVEGAGSAWEQLGHTFINNGVQIVRAGARASTLSLQLGQNSNPTDFNQLIVEGPGSEFTTRSLVLSSEGTNSEVRLTNGGQLNVAGFSSISGRLLLDGLGTQWLGGAESQTTLGERDNAELTIRNGAAVKSSFVQLGGFGHSANVEISGLGSRWETQRLEIGENARLELDEGRLLGSGSFLQGDPTIINRGSIRGSGFIFHNVLNDIGGRIEVGPSQRLVLNGLESNFQAAVDVIRGELESRSPFVNQVGARISLIDSTLRTPFASSQGEVAQNFGLITAIGDNHFYGAINNLPQGEIRLSGNGLTVFHDDIRNESIISVSAGSEVDFRGDYIGNGIAGGGKVAFDGEVSLQDDSGVVTFGGDLEFGTSSRLNIEVRQGESDWLNIAGQAILGGALELDVLSPLPGDTSLEIIDASTVIGTFDQVPAPGTDLGHGLVFGQVIYQADSVVISLLQQTADFNLDGSVDRLDLDAWSIGNGMARGAQLADGDADRDGDVDGADFIALQAAMHSTVAAANSQVVPEPTCCVLTLIASTCLAGVRRRQH